MRRVSLLVCVVAALLALPGSASAATCSQYSNQAEAQRAGDTRDADGDGIYCESLPCPCSTAAGGSSGNSPPPPPPPPPPPAKATCARPKAVQRLTFSKTKYENIRAHYLRAVKKGWPRILVVNRRGTEARRDKLLKDIPTLDAFDRDEYPPAVGRGRGSRGLTRGINPIGWRADAEYVPSSENRSHGSKLGAELKPYCNGTRFRYIFK
jgi:hypothetical protein